MHILVTGGAGYIGSHTIVQLIEAGHEVVAIDNLINSSAESINRIEAITDTRPTFYEADLRNRDELSLVFEHHPIDAVIHFAGLKAVGESVQKPLLYYKNNIDSTFALLDAMAAHGIKKLVFSSSATVYGSAPIPNKESESIGQGVTNPYGRTKCMIEQILSDLASADKTLEFTSLRYFNPIGAHPSGLIGEDPHGVPNNLMPYITQVATNKRDKLGVFGNDYETVDGTGVRDYIHVDDLAQGHLAALMHSAPGYAVYNLGTGKGTSVIELVTAFEKASGQTVSYEILARRSGDIPVSYANVDLAKDRLKWAASRTIDDACRDSWNWQSKNPDGYSV